MTGIGFLGAGVIFKEGLSVSGLTSAASIWTTAAIGLLIGAGFWWPAALGFVAVLGTLSVLRWAEDRFPRFVVFDQVLCFTPAAAPDPEQLRALLGEFGFRCGRLRLKLDAEKGRLEYEVAAYTRDHRAGEALAARLKGMSNVLGFDIRPSDD